MPVPAYTFTIPSLPDDLPLDCRIYHPKVFTQDYAGEGLKWHKRGAVVAHPYAPLGGCMSDAVVLAVTDELLGQGFVVGTFNFRGAQGSAGSTSWSGRPERGDFESFVAFFVQYLDLLVFAPCDGGARPASSSEDASAQPQTLAADSNADAQPACQRETINLIVAGYSYGSIVLMHLPPLSKILQQLETIRTTTPPHALIQRAQDLASETNSSLSTLTTHRGRQQHGRRTSRPITYGSSASPRSSQERKRSVELAVKRTMERLHHRPGRRDSRTQSAGEGVSSTSSSFSNRESVSVSVSVGVGVTTGVPSVKVHYVLISPVLAPLGGFLALATFGAALAGAFRSGLAQNYNVLLDNQTLVVFGTEDGFTSARRVRAWCEKMQMRQKAEGRAARLRWYPVNGAGHFWREDDAEDELRRVLREWSRAAIMDKSAVGLR